MKKIAYIILSINLLSAIIVLVALDFVTLNAASGLLILGFAAFVIISVYIFEKLPLEMSATFFAIVIVIIISYFFLTDFRNDLVSDLVMPKPVSGPTVCMAGDTGHDGCGVQCKCEKGLVWICEKKPCGKIIKNS